MAGLFSVKLLSGCFLNVDSTGLNHKEFSILSVWYQHQFLVVAHLCNLTPIKDNDFIGMKNC